MNSILKLGLLELRRDRMLLLFLIPIELFLCVLSFYLPGRYFRICQISYLQICIFFSGCFFWLPHIMLGAAISCSPRMREHSIFGQGFCFR